MLRVALLVVTLGFCGLLVYALVHQIARHGVTGLAVVSVGVVVVLGVGIGGALWESIRRG
jgi:hypothetical protein